MKVSIIILAAIAIWFGWLTLVDSYPQQTYNTVAAFSINNAGDGYDSDGEGTSVVNIDWTGHGHLEVPEFVSVTTTCTSDYFFYGLDWDQATYDEINPIITTVVPDITDDIIAPVNDGTTVTLPTAVGHQGKVFTIINNTTDPLVIATTSSQTINGTTPPTLTAQYDTITVVSDGSNWLITTSTLTVAP